MRAKSVRHAPFALRYNARSPMDTSPPPSTSPQLELFHAIADPPSAEARRFVVDHALEDRVRFRNVTYPEVLADLRARGGGHTTPALWDGTTLHQGAQAVVARLQAVVNLGRDA